VVPVYSINLDKMGGTKRKVTHDIDVSSSNTILVLSSVSSDLTDFLKQISNMKTSKNVIIVTDLHNIVDYMGALRVEVDKFTSEINPCFSSIIICALHGCAGNGIFVVLSERDTRPKDLTPFILIAWASTGHLHVPVCYLGSYFNRFFVTQKDAIESNQFQDRRISSYKESIGMGLKGSDHRIFAYIQQGLKLTPKRDAVVSSFIITSYVAHQSAMKNIEPFKRGAIYGLSDSSISMLNMLFQKKLPQNWNDRRDNIQNALPGIEGVSLISLALTKWSPKLDESNPANQNKLRLIRNKISEQGAESIETVAGMESSRTMDRITNTMPLLGNLHPTCVVVIGRKTKFVPNPLAEGIVMNDIVIEFCLDAVLKNKKLPVVLLVLIVEHVPIDKKRKKTPCALNITEEHYARCKITWNQKNKQFSVSYIDTAMSYIDYGVSPENSMQKKAFDFMKVLWEKVNYKGVGATFCNNEQYALQPDKYPYCYASILLSIVLDLKSRQMREVCNIFENHPSNVWTLSVGQRLVENKSSRVTLLRLFMLYIREIPMFEDFFKSLESPEAKKLLEAYEFTSVDNANHGVCRVCHQIDQPAKIWLCECESCPEAIHSFCCTEDQTTNHDLNGGKWFCGEKYCLLRLK
jgi:hypothetical protein